MELTEAIVNQIISDIDSNQNKERKERDFRSYDIYNDNQREYVKQELSCIFPESHSIMRVSNINVLKKVVNKIAMAYKDSPIRRVNGESNETLDTIYNEGKFHEALKEMDVGFNRSKCGLLWVQNDPNIKTQFKLHYLNQFTFDIVINNDTKELEVVCLSYPKASVTASNLVTNYSDGINQFIAEHQMDSANDATVYAMWSKESHRVVVKSVNKETTTIDYVKSAENINEENMLNKLPFVWLTSNPSVPEFPNENSLVDDSIEINILNSNLLTASQMQIGQLVMKYPQGSKVNCIHKGFTVSLELPQATENDPFIPTEAEYIVPNSDLVGMKSVVLDYAASILSDNGLEGASIVNNEKTFNSGIQMLIASSSAINIRKKNQTYYAEIEKEVFEILKAYDELNNTGLFNSDDSLTVTFKEPQVMKSETEVLDNIAKMDEMGLLEEYEKFLMKDPTMTKDDAIAKLERIKEEKKKRMQDATNSFMIPGDEEDADNEG